MLKTRVARVALAAYRKFCMNRKYIFIGLAVAVVAVVGVVLVWPGAGEVKNYPSSGTDVIAFGDSLVQGVGASAPEKNFVSVLSAQLGRPIVNLGVSGNTTTDGVQRLGELDKYQPKVVMILLSGNDRLRGIPQEQTLANLATIIEYIQNRGAVAVLLGVRGDLLGNGHDDKLKALAENRQAAYLPDVLDGLFGNSRYMADLVHPNDAGYAKIADRIYPLLRTYAD